jgi:hypothetical protein
VNYLIKFYGHNLEAAMQAGNRDHAVFWQAKMYTAIKNRNAALTEKFGAGAL